MKTSTQILLIVSVALAGCTQSQIVANQKRPNYFRQRVTNTDSLVPEQRDQLTYNPESANTPAHSFARNTPSLYPTDPVVGADAGQPNTGDTGPSTNVGAGPAGSNPVPQPN